MAEYRAGIAGNVEKIEAVILQRINGDSLVAYFLSVHWCGGSGLILPAADSPEDAGECDGRDGVFERRPVPDLIRTSVRVKEMRQDERLEPGSDST